MRSVDLVKKMLLGGLLLGILSFLGCYRHTLDRQPNAENEPTNHAPMVIISQAAQPSVVIEPTIGVIKPTGAFEPALQALSELTIANPILIVKKSERLLELWNGDNYIDSYSIDIGKSPVGDKKVQGDCKTPEGEYYIGYRNLNSHYYLSLGISYPNKEDAKEALDSGQIDQVTYDTIIEAVEKGM